MSDECLGAARQLREYLDGECGADLEAVIRAHLEHCAPCWDRADFELQLRAIVARKCQERAPEELVSRILDELRAGKAE